MTVYPLSACIDMVFADVSDSPIDRILAAVEAGCEGIEFWTWRDKPLEAMAEVVRAAGLAVPMMIVEPVSHLTDPSRAEEFRRAVEESAVAAALIGCQALVAVSNTAAPGLSPVEQDEAIVTALAGVAPIVAAGGIKLLLEPLNTLVDHPGVHVSGTAHGLDLVERVGRPEVGLLYDVYHSATMGETPVDVLGGRAELVGHVHVADTGGRHEPGTGDIPWHRVTAKLQAAGYRGFVGLEYAPTGDSAESVARARAAMSPARPA